MATYAIGDIQGCFAPFERLLKEISFDPQHDVLWIAGDLINRGPQSLEVLRYIKSLGEKAVVVLGNHDLHALGLYAGIRMRNQQDTCDALLAAPDVDDLMLWLRLQHVVYFSAPYMLLHAGLLPSFTLSFVKHMAALCEQQLRSDDWIKFLELYYSFKKTKFDVALPVLEQAAIALNVFTRIRVCNAQGELELAFTGPPEKCPAGYKPWFDWPQQHDQTVVCGHWSALGLHLSKQVLALDSGCIWGNQLTALRLEDRKVFQVKNSK